MLYLIGMSPGPMCYPEFLPRLSISIISIHFSKNANINVIPPALALNVLQSLHGIIYKNKDDNKITEVRTILQRESQNS